MVLLAGTVRNCRDIKTLSLYCLFGLVVGGAYAIYQYKTGTFTVNTIYDQRAAGLRGDPNDTAMLLVAGVPLAIYWFFNSVGIPSKFLSMGALALLLIGVILTGSRGGFVVLLLVAMMLFLRRPSWMLVGCGLLLVALFIAIAPQSYWNRMETLVTGKEEHFSESLKNRKMLQKIGTEIFFDNVVIGVGPGNFSGAFMARFAKKSQNGDSTYAVAHNMYLEFFSENGLVGGILFLMMFGQSLFGLLRLDRRCGDVTGPKFGLGFAIAIALGGMLFSGLFLSQAKNSVLWFVTGLGFAAGHIALRAHLEIVGKPSTNKSLRTGSEKSNIFINRLR